MEAHLSHLADVQNRLDEAVRHLQRQRNLFPDIDRTQTRGALLMLLSNGLRVFCWLEDQRNGLIEQIGEYLPLPRQ
jgi:hypothetical protein